MKIFLIACSIKEAEKLHTALEYRFVFISVFSPFHSLQSLTCAIEFRINQLKTDKENGVGEAEDDESVKVSLLLPPMNPQDDGMPSSETKFFPGKRGGGCWGVAREEDEALRAEQHRGVTSSFVAAMIPLFFFVNCRKCSQRGVELRHSELCPQSSSYCVLQAFRRRGEVKVQSCVKCGILRTHSSIGQIPEKSTTWPG